MRFVVSLLNFRPGRIGGTETYLRELVAHLPAALGGDEAAVVLDRDAAREIDTPGLERIVVDRSSAGIIRRRILEAMSPWRDREIERLFAGLDADATLFPQQSIYPKGHGGPAVLTVHDVQHLVIPSSIARIDRLFRRAIYPWSLRRADRVITVSSFTARMLVERCGLRPEECDPVLLGFDTRAPAITPTRRVAQPYLYFPAVTQPHKNHLLLLDTYAALIRRGVALPRLLMSGQRTSHWTRIEQRIRALGLTAHAEHAGWLTRAEVLAMYSGAEAVLFPSSYEGFGLPVVEAVAARRRIVTSDLEVFEELGVPRRLRIDFADPDALARALDEPPPFTLEREPVSWSETAARTLAVLREAARGISRRSDRERKRP